jgi:hypothetical protein
MGLWDNGTLGQWDFGTMGLWDNGTLGQWDFGTMGLWENGTLGQWDFGKMGLWDHGNLEEWDFFVPFLSPLSHINPWLAHVGLVGQLWATFGNFWPHLTTDGHLGPMLGSSGLFAPFASFGSFQPIYWPLLVILAPFLPFWPWPL